MENITLFPKWKKVQWDRCWVRKHPNTKHQLVLCLDFVIYLFGKTGWIGILRYAHQYYIPQKIKLLKSLTIGSTFKFHVSYFLVTKASKVLSSLPSHQTFEWFAPNDSKWQLVVALRLAEHVKRVDSDKCGEFGHESHHTTYARALFRHPWWWCWAKKSFMVGRPRLGQVSGRSPPPTYFFNRDF